MAIAKPVKRFTPAEYYQLEEEAAYKSDYYKGEIFAMAGGSMPHSLIAMNITGELRGRLRGKPCMPFESNLRLKVKATGLRTYPDASVYCKPLESDEEDPTGQTFTNPVVIFEVLSPSTEAFDRGLKSQSYRQIQSLRAYVLVSQSAMYVEMYERQAEGSWALREFDGANSVLKLLSIGVDLPLIEIYQGVDFSGPAAS